MKKQKVIERLVEDCRLLCCTYDKANYLPTEQKAAFFLEYLKVNVPRMGRKLKKLRQLDLIAEFEKAMQKRAKERAKA